MTNPNLPSCERSGAPAAATAGPQAVPQPEVALALLSDCHARLEQECAALRALAARQVVQEAEAEAEAGADANAAAARLLHFFGTTLARHHEDEETLLFPALIESMAGSDAVCLRELTRDLAAEHRALEAAWRPVRASLERMAAGDAALPLDAGAVEAVEALAGLCRRHTECEERELLPMAARLIADDELVRIDRAMREQRERRASR